MPQPTAAPDLDVAQRQQLAPIYNVVLLDDDEHSYDYVIEMLGRLFLFSEAEAFAKAVDVDTAGRTIVITCELPEAEFARDQIHAYGPDWRMPNSKGPMRAVIEPAAGGN